MHIQELAKALGAQVDPDANFEIRGAGTIEEAGAHDVTFLANPRYAAQLETSGAGAALIQTGFDRACAPVALRVDDPYLAFAKALEYFHRPPTVRPGIHPTAILGEEVTLGDDVAIGPYVVIGHRVHIGAGTAIHAHVVIYDDARIGPGSLLHSHAVVRESVKLGAGTILQNAVVIGADGFGFAPRPDRSWHKIPQTGTVEFADEVEVQAGACIDRATVGTTRIGRGSKIDNLVQVGHGSQVGEDTLLCGQVGLAGSSEIGDRVILAGQSGVAGHCRINDDIVLAAQAGAQTGLDAPGFYGGSPAMEVRTFRRWVTLQPKIPELFKRVRALEKMREDEPVQKETAS